MRPVVAIVETRPETILEDYRRAVALAQLADRTAGQEPVLAAAVQGGRWLPGFTSPPWQLDGVLAALADPGGESGRPVLPAADPIPVVPVGVAGRRDRPADPAHEAVLRRRGAAWMPGPAGTLLARRPLVLLPVPVLVAGEGLTGATALLGALLRPAGTGRPRRRGRAGEPLDPAALAAAARDILPRLGVVMDGVLWGAGAGTLRQGPIQRNVVLAGCDPVAVDAVAARLAGLDPLRVTWLRQCQDAGLGFCDPDRLRVVGHVELLETPFPGRLRAGSAVRRTLSGPGLQAVASRLLMRPRMLRMLRAHAATPWGRLAAEYRHDANPERPR